jgi:hypothetical protein
MSEEKRKRYPSESKGSFIDRRIAGKLAKVMFPNGLPELLGENERKLIDFLRSFTGTDHEKTVWDEYYRVRSIAEADLAFLESEADTEGLSIRELSARDVLQMIQKFVILHRIEPRSQWITNTTKVWVAELRVSKQTIVRWCREGKPWIESPKRGWYSIDIKHPFIRTEGWKKT